MLQLQETRDLVYRGMVFPLQRFGPSANPDLPAEVVRDFDEARSILGASPRGAAALLRLAIQKLCAHLGEKGRNIDEDIASLVACPGSSAPIIGNR
jgi:hypothetical protein